MSDATLGSEWRKPREQGFLIHLPSGKKAFLRPISFEVLARSGRIPDFLSPIVERMLSSTAEDEETALRRIQQSMSFVEMLKNSRQLQEIIAGASLVLPKVVETPVADDEISAEDIDPGDLQFIWQMAILPADELRTFSEKQARDLESLGHVQQLGDKTKRSSRSERVARKQNRNPRPASLVDVPV